MISAKVSNGTLVGIVSSLLTWALTYYIPAWHSGIPPALAHVIPAVVGAGGYFIGGYRSRHRATVEEVTTALDDAEQLIAVKLRLIKTIPPSTSAPSVGQTSPAGGANATG